MFIHQLVDLMKKALKETGITREFRQPNPGSEIQIYREQMIRDLLKTFDQDDTIQLEQARAILHHNMTVDAVVKPIQYERLKKIHEKNVAEMKNKKQYKAIFKGQELSFEKPKGIGPKSDSYLYEVFEVTKEIFISRLLALSNTDVRLVATPEIRQHYIESHDNGNATNSNNKSTLEIAIGEYHAANEKEMQLKEDLDAISDEQSSTRKRSREEYEAYGSSNDDTAQNLTKIKADLTTAKAERKQLLTKIDSIINTDPEHYKNYLIRQKKNPNWFSPRLTLAYARAHHINLCLWTGCHHLILGEESIPSPLNADEIKETIHVVLNLGEFYRIIPCATRLSSCYKMC